MNDKELELVTIPIYQVSFQPILFMGCDRELLMFSMLVAFALAFVIQTLFSFVFSILLFLFSLFVLKIMSKFDPYLRHVYMNHIKYKSYYPAFSGWMYVNNKLQESRYRSPS